MNQTLTPWIYRRWRFDFPAELHPAIIERLRGTPARAAELLASAPRELLATAPPQGWSIIRHIAHLDDLEPLLHARLDAYERAEPVLPAADMSNTKTTDQPHEQRDPAEVVAALRATRARTIERLESYPPDFFARSAWHERLATQKRVVDSALFFADHDDHHLALAVHARRQLAPGPGTPPTDTARA